MTVRQTRRVMTAALWVAIGVILLIASGAAMARPAAAGRAGDELAALEARVDAQASQIAELRADVDALQAALGSPTPAPAASPAPTPAATPTPTPAPSATPGPSPLPTSVPAPTPVVCGTTLQSVVDAAPAGGTVDLQTCTFAGDAARATIGKAITIRRGTIRPTSQQAIRITGSDVTFDGTSFDGGPGWTVVVDGADRTKFLNTAFQNAQETFVVLKGPGVDGVLFEGATFKVSGPYSAVSADDNGPFGSDFRNVTFRGITLDNGPQNGGWFGLEVWAVQNLVIEGSTFTGDDVHISIPRSDGAIIRNNTFDLTRVGWAAIELADVDGVQVTGNTASGPAPAGAGGTWNAFIQTHQGGGAFRNNVIEGNRLSNYTALFNAAESSVSGNVVRNNCLQNVGRLNWGNASIGFSLSGNGPC